MQMGLVKVAGRAGRAGQSVELCNKEVVQSPSHPGRLAVQGRARFSTRSEVPTTQMLSWVASSPIRIPSRETTPALPNSESYLVPFSVCLGSLTLGRVSIPRAHLYSWTHGLTAQKDLRPVPLDCSPLLYPQFASSLGSDLNQTAQVHS